MLPPRSASTAAKGRLVQGIMAFNDLNKTGFKSLEDMQRGGYPGTTIEELENLAGHALGQVTRLGPIF